MNFHLVWSSESHIWAIAYAPSPTKAIDTVQRRFPNWKHYSALPFTHPATPDQLEICRSFTFVGQLTHVEPPYFIESCVIGGGKTNYHIRERRDGTQFDLAISTSKTGAERILDALLATEAPK